MSEAKLPPVGLDGRIEVQGLVHHLKVAMRVNLFVALPFAVLLTVIAAKPTLPVFGRYLLVVVFFTNVIFVLLACFYHWIWLRASLAGAWAYVVLGVIILPALGALGTIIAKLILDLIAPDLLQVRLESLLVIGMLLATLSGLAIYQLEDYRRTQVRDRLRLAKSRQREVEVQQAREHAELVALYALIKPHFIFNVLSAIATLIDEDPALAENTTLRLARLLRYILDIQDRDLIRLDEEISIVTAYLEIEKIRLGARLDYEIEVPDCLRAARIPGMVLQPLVENAVLHGIRQRGEAGGYVRVTVNRDGSSFVARIYDNGPGFSSHQGTGKATRLLRSRLDRLYDGNYALSMERQGSETIVEVRLPTDVGRARASERRQTTS